MTEKYFGSYLTKNPIQPTLESASGIWKLDETIYAIKNNSWPQPIVIETPTFIIDFTQNTEIDPRLVFVRNSNATYYNSQRILLTAAPAQMRIDHDPENGELLGILIEEARTNLLHRSEELDNAYWNKSNVEITANSAVAPDGTTAAYALSETEVESAHGISRAGISLDMTAGNCSFSAFVKTDLIKNILLKIDGGNGNDLSALFAMDLGFPLQEYVNGSSTLRSTFYHELPNGWSRIGITGKTGVNGSHVVSLLLCDGDNTIYLGSSAESYYIWGVQLEQGDFQTSYIKTTSAAAQRVVDILTVADESFLNHYNENEGTVFFEGTSVQNGGSKNTTIGASLYLSDENHIRIVFKGQADTDRIELSGRLESDTTTRTFATFDEFTGIGEAIPIKTSIGLKKNEYPKVSINGSTVKTGATGNSGIFLTTGIPLVFLGNFSGSVSASETVQNGHVKKFSYWNKRLSDQHLKYISSSSYNIDTLVRFDFDLTTNLDSRISFSRNSAGTYFTANGSLTVATNDEPRFDHDPLTNTQLGILIEEPGTNLANFSEEIDNAYWTKTNSTVTADSVAAPDSNTTADSLLETSATGEHGFHVDINAVDMTANAHSFSIFVKTNQRSRVSLELSDTAANKVVATADLTAKSINHSSFGSSSSAAAKITELANGWFRIAVSGKTGVSGTHRFAVKILDDTGSDSFSGDTAKGLYVWGSQIEIGSKPSSYIPTYDATVTREGDLLLVNSTNFSTWFNQVQGTVYWQGRTDGHGAASATGFDINDNTANERYQTVISDSINSTASRAKVTDGGTDVAVLDSPDPRLAVSPSLVYKQIFSYKVDEIFFLSKGLSVPASASSDTSATLPTVSQLSLGASYVSDAASGFLNGHLSKFYYWNSQLPEWRSRDILR